MSPYDQEMQSWQAEREAMTKAPVLTCDVCGAAVYREDAFCIVSAIGSHPQFLLCPGDCREVMIYTLNYLAGFLQEQRIR